MYQMAGQPRCMAVRQSMPTTESEAPSTRGHFRRRVEEIRKPVAAPVAEAMPEEKMSRKPDVVAVVRRTPWKNRGLRSVD